jgi:hypothetical protein
MKIIVLAKCRGLFEAALCRLNRVMPSPRMYGLSSVSFVLVAVDRHTRTATFAGQIKVLTGKILTRTFCGHGSRLALL